MATIKSFTDLEQSKELAKILPIKSADMCYKCIGEDPYDVCLRPYSEWREEYKGLLVAKEVDAIPCWSLTALLSVLPNYQLQTQDDGIGVLCSCNGKFNIVTANNPVDACVEMILKLHELNLI